jgi:hypothetical protein
LDRPRRQTTTANIATPQRTAKSRPPDRDRQTATANTVAANAVAANAVAGDTPTDDNCRP